MTTPVLNVNQLGSLATTDVPVDSSNPLPTLQAPSSDVLYAPTNSTQAAAATSKVIKATPGTLYNLSGYNAKGSAQFIQLHDATSLPADTAVPVYSFTVATVGNFNIDFGTYGMAFATGIVVCNSSTVATKTIGSADCSFFARYK